jgi:murein DD-endopeptidase MepM/ murein hydrolase activator NlpD
MFPCIDYKRYRKFGKLYFTNTEKYYQLLNSGKIKEANKLIIGFHLGHDFDAPFGTEFCAVFDGEIIGMYNINGFGGMFPNKPGWVIFIKHINTKYNEPFIGIYGHCMEPNLKIGQKVKEGETIGKINHFYVGGEDLPHLHLGYYLGDIMPQLNHLGYVYNSNIKIDTNRYVKNINDLKNYRDPILKLS